MKPIRIDLPMYSQLVYFGDNLKSLEKKLAKDDMLDPEYDRTQSPPKGAAGFVRLTGCSKHKQYIKLVVVQDGSPATLAHELSHACIEMMRDMSEGDVFHAPEQYCYLMGYLYGECYKAMFGGYPQTK